MLVSLIPSLEYDFCKRSIKQRKQREKNTFKTINCEDSIERIIRTGLQEIKDRYDCQESEELMHQYYQNTRLRSHFGKNIVENFMSNIININPLMDRELQKLRTGDDTLLCLILIRYMDEVKDIKFDSGRTLDENSLKDAHKINSKFVNTLKSKSSTKFEIIDNSKKVYEKGSYHGGTDIKSSIIDLYQSKKIERLVTDVLGYEAYRRGYLELSSGRFIAERMMYSLLAVAATQEAVEGSIGNSFKTPNIKPIADNIILLEVLDFFKIARIDLKNVGKDSNNLEITDFDDGVGYKIMTPKFANKKKDGVGYVIESKRLEHNLQLKCIGSGELVITLKGVDVRDNCGKRVEAWADFVSFKINGEEQLEGLTAVWHDKPYIARLNVENNQIVDIKLQWLPHNYGRNGIAKKIEEIYESLSLKPIKS